MAKSYLGEIPNVHIRDFQRAKVYRAEEQCTFWKDGMQNILSKGDVLRIVQTIAHWANIDCPTIIYPEYNDTSYNNTPAFATADSLVLPFARANSLPFICHEMAHVINYNSENADHHGAYFVTTYLNVVKQFIGKDASNELKKSFKSKHVKYIA